MEVKPVAEDTPQTADGRQVARYWKHYGCVLVTNYRDFLLVVKEPDAKTPRGRGPLPACRRRRAFWRAKPRTLAKEHGEGLLDFLAGAMTRIAPIARPSDLAADLARHAREAKRRLAAHDISGLGAAAKRPWNRPSGCTSRATRARPSSVRRWCRRCSTASFPAGCSGGRTARNGERFDWKGASEHLALPLIGDLYEEIARPRRLADLGLREPLEWATASLNRVVEDEFFQRFDTDHAITLFYEPFLQAFDPDCARNWASGTRRRRSCSTWSAGSINCSAPNWALPTAWPTTRCSCSTRRRAPARTWSRSPGGSIRRSAEQGHGSLAAARVKRALRTRIFGFEILPAPYVVAHLQLGVFLRSLGATLDAAASGSRST